MDLGCMDLCSISSCEKQMNDLSVESKKKDRDSDASVHSSAKAGKNKVSKETGQSVLNTVNKSNSQMKKSHRRSSSSPLNWFPRRKMDSYLKRKIRLLQEVGGMNATLDETLGDSNPHYSRVLREKIAAREAACKAMEARKDAMVEASWCRILRTARIQSKEAESLLLEAEKTVAEAFEAAAAMGVIMYDRPDCPKKPCEVESTSVNMGGSPTHTVTATFETAFEVDKEVAAAVKQAFIRLANCHSSSNKEEFRDLVWKVSQNPDMDNITEELSDYSSGCESDTRSELELDTQRDNMLDEGRQQKCKNKQVPDINSTKLVDMMFERLKCLQEDELASLAIIVATCGLNAVLLEVENTKHHDSESITSAGHSTRRCSLMGTGAMGWSSMEYLKDGKVRRKQDAPELPSLDKFLVKHTSKLEKEVQEAKKRKEAMEGSEVNLGGIKSSMDNPRMSEAVPDLGSILLIKHASKLEKEIEAAKKTSGKEFERKSKQSENTLHAVPGFPSLDTVLVKHMSRLEREVHEAKNMRKNELKEGQEENPRGLMKKLEDNKHKNSTSSDVPNLASILVKKHSSKLEKEIAEEKKKFGRVFDCTEDRTHFSLQRQGAQEVPGLDKVLVKHVSRLEREVQEAKSKKEVRVEISNVPSSGHTMLSSHDGDRDNSFPTDEKQVGKENIDANQQIDDAFLDDAVTENKIEQRINKDATTVPAEHKTVDTPEMPCSIKTMSRIERAKLEAMQAFSFQNENGGRSVESSLDSILVKPIHRLEREKMQAIAQRLEYETKNDQKKQEPSVSDCNSLDKILVKHVSRLEKEKRAASKEDILKVRRKDSQFDNSAGSLDQILVKHQPRSPLAKEKFTLSQQPDNQVKHFESRQEARQRELQEAWGGLSLGNAMRPHLSRLEKDKAAWIKAEEEERRQARREM